MDIFIHFLCEGRLIKQLTDIFPREIIRHFIINQKKKKNRNTVYKEVVNETMGHQYYGLLCRSSFL